MAEWDLLNWQTMIIELIIAGALAVVLSVYFYNRQERRQKDLEATIIEQKKILDSQHEHKKDREKQAYSELKNNLEFLYKIIPIIDKQRKEFSKTKSHDSKVMISTQIQKFPNIISDLQYILHKNNDIIETKIFTLIENFVSNIQIYYEAKYDVSLFANDVAKENPILGQISTILEMINSRY